ncbi:MAG: Re/Si-specific NAD(P)(+) transhydrogenase subunit alpha [Ignavibacteriae bacterium]|nr:Re/Si-specific NAD(P)(+) transhydrogenase subunit alpha [Ignavibacteriota bacterium]
MKIGVPKETLSGETRVALIPSLLSALTKEKHEVLIERNAGAAASHSDDEYEKAGGKLVDANTLYAEAEIVLKVQPPTPEEAAQPREGSSYISFFAPLINRTIVETFLKRRITSYSMQYVPRITRAQSMDALSSMANIAGYKAVLMGSEQLDKIFPMMMTAAGTITPSIVLVLGAGVAGLQAIATAKRLGAKVEAFDPRPAVKDQVKSVGATFLEMEITENVETAGGYAKEQSEEFLRREQEVIGARLPKVDVVISTAQIFGKRAPVLITTDMVKKMRSGSVIVDLAAEQGGNCELTEAGKTVTHNGVKIIGAVNLPATVPVHASQMYAKNVVNLLQHLFPKGSPIQDLNDDIVKGACITRNGEIVNDAVRNALQQGGKS